MFRSALTTLAETVATMVQQTAGTRDAIYHSLKWLSTPLKDISFPNAYFTPSDQNPHGIILCGVHGTADNVMAFSDLAHFLLDKLPSTVKSVELFAFKERGKGVGIENFAKQTVDKLEAMGCKQVIFAGHSRGGLVVKKATTLAEARGIKVLLCFSICAPHGGSSLALPPLTWVSNSINEMKKGSEFLEKEMRELADPEIHVSVGAACDSIVSPEDAVLQGAPYRIFQNQGHLSIMHDPAMFRYFLEHLQRRAGHRADFPVATLTTEEEKAEEKTYETIVLPAITPKLMDIYYEINLFKEDVWQRPEFILFPDKKAVLDELQQMLMAMMTGQRLTEYPAANTFDDFLLAFLGDKTEKGMTRMFLLEQTYRYPVSIFMTAGVAARQLVERLRMTYKDVVLPEVPAPQPVTALLPKIV